MASSVSDLSPRRSYRRFVAYWVFVAALAPAGTVLLAFTVVLSASESLVTVLVATLPSFAALLVLSSFVAWIASARIAQPLRVLRSAATLAVQYRYLPQDMLSVVRRTGIREVNSVAKAFVKLNERAVADASRRDRLASYIAHDVRTPIAAAAMRLEGSSRSEDVEVVSDLRSVLGDLERLVAALRGAHEPSAPDESNARVWVGAAVHDVVDRLPVRQGLSVDVEVQRDFATTLADSALRSVLENLLTNALRYAAHKVEVQVALGHVRVMNDVRDAMSVVVEDDLRQPHGLGWEIVRHALATGGGHLRLEERSAAAFCVIAYLPVFVEEMAS